MSISRGVGAYSDIPILLATLLQLCKDTGALNVHVSPVHASVSVGESPGLRLWRTGTPARSGLLRVVS
jgi:hypothetical protein